jgi:D-alanyl-D-alanine carboxypeptidase
MGKHVLLSWKTLLPLALLLALALWAAPRLSKKIAPYQPSADRDLSGWGTLDPTRAASLQSALDVDVNRLDLPGIQAAIQTADGQTWYSVSGTADRQRRIPLRRDHILRIGSTTKTFTAVLILQLVEEAKLSLDDPLARWFPDFSNAQQVTVRDLLTHRSGIYEILENPAVRFSLFFPRKTWQPQELVSIATQETPHAQGEYYYSNTNYILLGLIAERVTGQDATTLYRQQILSPLGLRNTHFVPYEPAPQTLISGYDRDMIPLPGLYELTPASVSAATAAYTSGAMVSTAEDLIKFYDGLFSGKLLTPTSLDAITTFYDARDPGTPQLTGYGLGLFRLDIDGEEVWASLGEFIGSMTMATYSPSKHDVAAIIGNLSLFDYVSVWKDLTMISR